MGQGCSTACGRCCKRLRGKKRRERAQPAKGVSTVVEAPATDAGTSGKRRGGLVRVVVHQEDMAGDREDAMTPQFDAMSPEPALEDDEDMMTAQSSFHHGRRPKRLNKQDLDKLTRAGSQMLAFDVCSIDRGTFSDFSEVSSESEVDAEVEEHAQRSESPAATPPSAAGATELDARQLDYVMSRIFSTTYHTPAMCLLNLSARSELTLLSSKQLSNSVMVSERFSKEVFGKAKTSGNEVLAWLLRDEASENDGAPQGEFTPLSPRLSPDDRVFLADQQRILRRLLMKPRPKGNATADASDVDSEFDDSDSEYDPEEHLHQRTLEEGFCQLLLPREDERVPVVATVYVSTIAAKSLPADVSSNFKRQVTPLLGVISVVGIRALDQPSITPIANTLADFPKSACVLRDLASGSVFAANECPCFIRSSQFTGNVFIKTVTDPTPDPRIQPYFEGKNRKFEIQIQGRITTNGIDLTKGNVCFAVFLEDKLSDPEGKPLSWGKNAIVGAIVRAFKVIARGGLLVMTGNENESSFPMMGIPILSVMDRLSLRGNLDGALPPADDGEKKPHKSPPLALGVEMLPETPELSTLKKTAEKEAKQNSKDKTKEPTTTTFKDRETSYTMSFHSQYLDFESWMMRKVPGFSNVNLRTYWGHQHAVVSVVFLPHGVPLTELRTKGTFLLKLRVEHRDNVQWQAEAAARAAEEAAAAQATAVHSDPMSGL